MKSEMDGDEIKRLTGNLQDERNGQALYEALAAAEKDPRLAEVYRRFAEVEQRHGRAWADKLTAAGAAVPVAKVTWRTSVLIWLARRWGAGLVVPTVAGIEQAASTGYRRQDDAATMAPEEASHARLLQQIAQSDSGGLQGGQVAQLEGRHRGGGNALRAAVLGANDGLVSNLSLVMGVAGAATAAEFSNSAILVTGLAGLLAGAFSMALGEWLSVQSSRELYQRQIEIERAEIAQSPAEEAEELALIYQARGLETQQARTLAEQILANKDTALATLVREELGIDPEELGGSAWVAAITSFCLFALGAVLPVIPFMILRDRLAIGASAALSTVGLFGIGAAITLFTGKPAWWSGLRMVLFGLAAAAITFGIGRLIGVSIS